MATKIKTAFVVTDGRDKIFSFGNGHWKWDTLRLEGAVDLPSAMDQLQISEKDPAIRPKIVKVRIEFLDLDPEDLTAVEKERLNRVITKLSPEEIQVLTKHLNREGK